MWQGQALPPTSHLGYATGFKAVAVKTVPDDTDGVTEEKALAAVRDRLAGTPGPHHITSLLEVIRTVDAEGKKSLKLVTP